MANLDERQLLTISVVVVALALGGSGAGIYWAHRELGKVRRANDALAAQVQAATQKINEIPALKAKRDALLSKLAVYEETLPDRKELENMVETLGDYEKAAGVEILSVRPQPRTLLGGMATEAYEEYPYKLVLKGDFFSFAKFLNRLENHNRFIRVDAFRISKKDPDSLMNDIDLDICTFSYRWAAAVGERVAPRR